MRDDAVAANSVKGTTPLCSRASLLSTNRRRVRNGGRRAVKWFLDAYAYGLIHCEHSKTQIKRASGEMEIKLHVHNCPTAVVGL